MSFLKPKERDHATAIEVTTMSSPYHCRIVAAPPTHSHTRSSERLRKENMAVYDRLHTAYDVERTIDRLFLSGQRKV